MVLYSVLGSSDQAGTSPHFKAASSPQHQGAGGNVVAGPAFRLALSAEKLGELLLGVFLTIPVDTSAPGPRLQPGTGSAYRQSASPAVS